MSIHERFLQQFGRAPLSQIFVPGRVNLIGEHIDYNGGQVLPHALRRGVTLALAPRTDQQVVVWSERFVGVSTSALGGAPSDIWARYAFFSVQLAVDEGWTATGANIAIMSDLSDGAGLSSSAALCVATLKAIRDACGVTVTDVEIAKLARRVENDYIGVPCGIMDQMAVSVAASGEALLLDTATLDYEAIPLPEDKAFVALHSGVHRELADGRYKARKEECDIAKEYFGTDNLCQLTLAKLETAENLPLMVKRRVRHCITEHQRTVTAAGALRSGDMGRFGELMVQSHHSMRDDFEISVPAIDQLVETSLASGALGARLTGGGFGGCIVAAVERSKVEVWLRSVLTQHPGAFLVQA